MKHLLLILTCFISFQTISQTKLLKDVSSTKQMSVEVTTLFKQNKINEEKWEQIVNAYRQYLSFGTGGIRGMMAFDKSSVESKE